MVRTSVRPGQASLVVSVPVVAGFLLMQKYLIAGLTAGAVE
jgi:multiple sugar transport system permease protein